MVRVLERVLGGETIKPDCMNTTSVVINAHRYSINVGRSGTVTNSQLDAAGNQMVVQGETSKQAVLATPMPLARARLGGDRNRAVVRDLGDVITGRADMGIEDIGPTP